MSQKLVAFFNKQPRLGSLSTAGKDGRVNAGTFGSIRMIDDKTATIALGKNRTFTNLQENPNAVFLIMEPGPTPPEWKGVRVYLKMTGCHTSGPELESRRAEVAKAVGEEMARKMIHASVTFEVQEVRPLLDMGQGWEKAIGG
ncbi:MAG: pyridoxamine 5'-phosphate oxidase family protein [Deltaproteobacteria bacterium]|nr:pyridoxamine 5'-phosphate oxidase family protein [Deltaproteobacteria bacterium]